MPARTTCAAVAASLAVTVALAAGSTPAPAAAEDPVACGSSYTIAGGDTLFLIAERSYGDGWKYRQVFLANADLLSDPAAIEVGDRLLVPCLDGSGPADRRTAQRMGLIPHPDNRSGHVISRNGPAGTMEGGGQADTQAEALAAPEAVVQARNEQTIEQSLAAVDGGAIAGDRAIVTPPADLAAARPAPVADGPARAFTGADGMDAATGVGTNGSVAGAILSVPGIADDLSGGGLAETPADRPARPTVTPGPLDASATWTAASLLHRAAQFVARTALPGAMVLPPLEPVPLRDLPDLGDPDAGDPDAGQPQPPAAAPVELRLLTGSGFAPYADEALPAGGMITDMIGRAIRQADPARAVSVAFIDDWPAHLEVLLPRGAFDVAFPYHMPDCSRIDRLSLEMRQRCDGFLFSNALYAVEIASYARAEDPLAEATGADALFGKTLCRPAGEVSYDLSQAALVEPYVRLLRPETAFACFVMLMREQVDVVTMPRQAAEDEIVRRELGMAVAEVDGLATAQTLHAVAPKSDPNARANLDLINRGLAALMTSGEWFEIVARHQRNRVALAQ